MNGTEELPEQTARGLLSLVFDEHGIEVPGDDLAPAAMATYRGQKRRRAAFVTAAASAAVVAVAGGALAFDHGSRGAANGSVHPAVYTTPTRAVSSSPTTAQASPSVPGGGGSPAGVGDCFGNWAPPNPVYEIGLTQDKMHTDCLRAKDLWQAVFPASTVASNHDPEIGRIIQTFIERVPLHDALAKGVYGVPQPQLVKDWTEAAQADAGTGELTWSAFTITSASGQLKISAQFHTAMAGITDNKCLHGKLAMAPGDTQGQPCENVTLSGGGTAIVTGSAEGFAYGVTITGPNGDIYALTFSGDPEPRYISVKCTAAGGVCNVDLSDGTIRVGRAPDQLATLGNAGISHKAWISPADLISAVKSPAFANLVHAFFAEGLGH